MGVRDRGPFLGVVVWVGRGVGDTGLWSLDKGAHLLHARVEGFQRAGR